MYIVGKSGLRGSPPAGINQGNVDREAYAEMLEVERKPVIFTGNQDPTVGEPFDEHIKCRTDSVA
jgi:hypothetical protein